MNHMPDYWQHKLSVFLHYPPHKCLDIRKHEQWAREVAAAVGCPVASKEAYRDADMIASGLTRAALPGYDPDSNKNGSVEFIRTPAITHPVVSLDALNLGLPTGFDPDLAHQDLLKLLARDVASLSSESAGEERAKQLYHYFFFALRKRLRNENAGTLGAAWDFLPADSRMPDHSIWHHAALTSAMASSMREDGNDNISLAVFSITPVQAFISKARKLRDYWFGSVILSYLSFVGIRHIAQAIGPDHIVYPSLHDQSLVEGWLAKELGLEELLKEHDDVVKRFMDLGKSIASFPNKFVFIAPAIAAEELCRLIEVAVQAEWLRIATMVRDFLGTNAAMATLFDHQVSDYWHYSFASCRLPRLAEKEALGKVLHEYVWSDEVTTVSDFSKAYGDRSHTTARIYAATHSLIQGVLAAAKLKPTRIRKSQSGEKCPLCGEHEVLHDLASPELGSARSYAEGVGNFWNALRARFNSEGSSSEIGSTERLCAVCSVKRFLPRVLKQKNLKSELLYEVVADVEGFPATTGIAAHDYLRRLDEAVGIPGSKRAALIDALHASTQDDALDESEPADVRELLRKGKNQGINLTTRDKYYAILMMDGDKMGDLINGGTITATWGRSIHPELRKRFETAEFQPRKNQLKGYLNKKRTINPALHAAISDSLNSFARFAVAPLVSMNGGRLIYAGGDDVCAIVPLDAVLDTADAIRKAYTAGFVRYTADGVVSFDGTASHVGKWGVHLAPAPGISISAGIVIAHHKQPLKEVLRDAHALLDGVAKKKADRNAVAIRLKKRSGGDRDFYCKWDEKNPFLAGETILESFCHVANGVGDSLLSSSLLYRLASLEDGIAPMRGDLAANRERITKLFAFEAKHSGLSPKPGDIEAARLAGITLNLAQHAAGKEWFNPEAAVIAGFLGRKERK